MENISYQKSGYFSKLICDYLDKNPNLDALYNRFPTVSNFKLQIEEKQQNFNPNKRIVLTDILFKQYNGFAISQSTKQNVESLQSNHTFTITTGHQLNIFTGPLYFLYKIINAINLSRDLKLAYPDYNFVPVYWMASEDHDFEEINHLQLHEKVIRWNKEVSGPVGRISTQGLEPVFEIFAKEIGNSDNAKYLISLFKKSYLEHQTLAAATRFLVNELFGEMGLVIIDGDDKELKKEFVPFAKKELLDQSSYANVIATNKKLLDYEIQVNPREINLFYIEDTIRERILFENKQYKVKNTDLTFSQEEILNELESNPQKFSPNVVLRPLYQEVILPNLCYIGGGGELAYWLQLKSNFDYNTVTFPILLLRNSVLLITPKQQVKKEKLNLTWEELFCKQKELVNNKAIELSSFQFDFSTQKQFLQQQFDALTQIATQTDKSFIGAVKAQEMKQLKGLDNLEKRLLKAEKRNHSNELERIVSLQNQLFPNASLQERQLNFAEFYVEYGSEFITLITRELKPLSPYFTVMKL